MQLSKRNIETLIDLVANKLSLIELWDRGDARELEELEQCLEVLNAMIDDAPKHVLRGRARGEPANDRSASSSLPLG